MLSSITPLGQRGRGMSWRRTVVSFWIGAVATGALVFGSTGALGAAVGDEMGWWLPLLALTLAAGMDLARVKPPGPRRQVDENWLGRYRDWVVGLGYGAQLGAGFVTIMTSFGTWALLVVAAASGPALGAALGAAFGLGRSVLLLRTRRVGSAPVLAGMMQRFASEELLARRASLAGYAVVVLMVGFYVA